MYAHSTAFAFGLLSFQNVLKNNNYKGAIFSILGILSHSIGIAYALIFVFLKFLLQKKYFILKNYIFFVLFSLIVLFFYNFNIQLTNTNISNTDLYSQFTDKLNILGTFKYQIFELKKHFETIPVFSSFGIYFVVIATLVSLSIKNSFIKNQKSLFCILVSLSITILISLFTNSSLAILERLQ